jgi:2,3-bisphosphoglycerate-dependent phosphoglycerate mutase
MRYTYLPQMKQTLFLLIVALCLLGGMQQLCAQQQAGAQHTFILVRHAEKVADGTKDPVLTPQGEARAKRLAKILADQKVDSLLSTDYKRTLATLAPLAEQKNKEIGRYAVAEQSKMLDGLLNREEGGVFVISGHSNTLHLLINYLMKEERAEELSEQEYGKIFILHVRQGQAHMLELRYPD